MNLKDKKIKLLFALVFGLLILASAIGGFYYHSRQENKKTQKSPEIPTDKVSIYIPTREFTLVKKDITIKKEENELKKLELTLSLFIEELPMPLKETKINEVYRDRENFVYLDLSHHFSAPSDAKEEFYLLKALYITLKTNFNWIRDLKILINGEEVETLSGHVSAETLKELLEGS